jgi:outer membrane protein OmpA-like peptidoglycan-associated protein/tetratricopeptide (TPR) repeat protein
MKKIFILLVVMVNGLLAQAQFTFNYLKAADEYYKKADYFSAATYYEKYINSGKTSKQQVYDPYSIKKLTKEQQAAVSNRQQAIYNLAESYRQLHYPSKAEAWYKQAASFDSKAFPLATYWYAKTLKSLEKFDVADSAFKVFTTVYTNKDLYLADATREMSNLDFIKTQMSRKDLKLFTVNKAGGMVNTNGAAAAPVWVNANTLWFTSTRSDSSAEKNKVHINRIYQTTYSDGVAGSVAKIAVPQTSGVHQGVVSLTPDGGTLFLTRWVIADGKKTSTLYKSTKENGQWTEPISLDATINAAGSSTQQPFVMPDGKNLLFASDRSGGFGGFDVWAVALQGNNTSGEPVNLGSTINTAFDEVAPYYHAASQQLVFSSDGRTGMGGLDFFAAKGTWGNWSNPENLGHPLNSVKDDVYFVSKGNAKNLLGDVLFSSDRSSPCCLELFSLQKERPLKQINGAVVACDGNTPVAGATVEVVNNNNKVVATQTTDANGKYSFTLVDFEALKANATADGYIANSVTVTPPADDESINLSFPPLCLTKPVVDIPPPVDTIVIMDNIYFEFNKAIILPESFAAIDNQIVTLLNKYPTMVIEIGGHTDALGDDAYNMNLSAARANSVKKYLESKGIAAERLEAKGYGETKPIADNTKPNGKDNPEGRKKNRRTEFKVLHY